LVPSLYHLKIYYYGALSNQHISDTQALFSYTQSKGDFTDDLAVVCKFNKHHGFLTTSND